MTIIAYKSGELAADGVGFSGGMRIRTVERKITRSDKGLLATAGHGQDGYLASLWFADGMKDEHPTFAAAEDDPVYLMWIKPDGSPWFADHRLIFTPLAEPCTMGEEIAKAFAEGAMAFGASAGQAVRLAITRCVWAGGETQIERISECPVE
jgi:hypothetical protein